MAKSANTEKKGSGTGRAVRRPAGRSRRWGVLLLVAVWMFVLGVLVGRGTAPVHFDTEALQKELASLREAVVEKEEKRFRIFENDDAAEKAENLEFYENLKKSAPEGTPSPMKKDIPKPESEPPAPAKPSNRTETAPERSNENRPPGLGAEPLPARKKPYTIQVASLKEIKTAESLVEKLQAGGFPAYRERAVIEGKGTWHRVRIGSFSGPADAARTLQRLKSAKLNPLLIRK